MNLVAQIFGFMALICLCYNYLQTNKKKFLRIQILSNILYGSQYLMLKAISALSMNIVSILRALIFYKYEKNNKKIPFIIFILFEISIIVLGIIFYTTWYSIIPVVIALIFTFGIWQKDMRITYTIAVISSLAWIYYDFRIGAYVGTVCSMIELCASIIGLTKSIKKFRKVS